MLGRYTKGVETQNITISKLVTNLISTHIGRHNSKAWGEFSLIQI